MLALIRSTFNSIASVMAPLHKEGYIFVSAFFVFSCIGMIFWTPLAVLGMFLTAFCAYFFRDPDRMVPQRENLVLSPGDGRICAIEEASLPEVIGLDETKYLRISVFLSVLDVHVNRIPISGTIKKIVYREGAFYHANVDKASNDNEQNIILLETNDGTQVGFVQIAGWIARRIVCYAKENQQVVAGERYGIIRFGSRVDVYLPEGTAPLVAVGQRVLGGETILAKLGENGNPISARLI
jgi:phosphatidylserine decarboxylase